MKIGLLEVLPATVSVDSTVFVIDRVFPRVSVVADAQFHPHPLFPVELHPLSPEALSVPLFSIGCTARIPLCWEGLTRQRGQGFDSFCRATHFTHLSADCRLLSRKSSPSHPPTGCPPNGGISKSFTERASSTLWPLPQTRALVLPLRAPCRFEQLDPGSGRGIFRGLGLDSNALPRLRLCKTTSVWACAGSAMSGTIITFPSGHAL
jgi:hypothetical protein